MNQKAVAKACIRYDEEGEYFGEKAKVFWPPISNALTGVKAKEISESRFPVFPNFLGLVLGCIEAKFCK